MKNIERGFINRAFPDRGYNKYDRVFGKRNITTGSDEEIDQKNVIPTQVKRLFPFEPKNESSALNFDFEGKDSSWVSMYRQLAGFVQTNGHALLPGSQDHEVLRDWLNRQILNKRLLSENQFQKLDCLGVNWDTPLSRDHAWELMYSRLKGFHKILGHCRVPYNWAGDKQLVLWVVVQRRVYLQKKMREDRQRLLDEIGFIWSAQDRFNSQWENFFQQLATFQQEHGHCKVPCKQEKLVGWIERQRLLRKKNLLLAGRERRLDEINFIWSFECIKKKAWEEKYRQLREYRKAHGHSFVPVNSREDKSLGIWVASQRWLEARGKLSPDKKKKLNKLNFVWSKDTRQILKSGYDSQWEINLGKLKAYRQIQGTCQVSLKSDPVLQRWTVWQRKMFYQGRMSAGRIDRLNEIGFPWSVQEGYWMRMHDALVNFNKQFGHTRVPSRWDQNPQLAAWIYRMKLNREQLDQQKIDLLTGIGFEWTLIGKTVVPWELMYCRLVSFKETHGHTRVPVKWPEDSKLGKWVSRMRNQREQITPERATLLDAIAFDWGQRI